MNRPWSKKILGSKMIWKKERFGGIKGEGKGVTLCHESRLCQGTVVP